MKNLKSLYFLLYLVILASMTGCYIVPAGYVRGYYQYQGGGYQNYQVTPVRMPAYDHFECSNVFVPSTVYYNAPPVAIGYPAMFWWNGQWNGQIGIFVQGQGGHNRFYPNGPVINDRGRGRR